MSDLENARKFLEFCEIRSQLSDKERDDLLIDLAADYMDFKPAELMDFLLANNLEGFRVRLREMNARGAEYKKLLQEVYGDKF